MDLHSTAASTPERVDALTTALKMNHAVITKLLASHRDTLSVEIQDEMLTALLSTTEALSQ